MEYIKELVNIYTKSAKNRDFKCLKSTHENNYPWDEDIFSICAKKDNLECLKSEWYENEHLDCLKYAHENGCPCDKNLNIYKKYFTI